MVYEYNAATDELRVSPYTKSKKCTLLMHAILHDNFDFVSKIIYNDPGIINQQNEEGWTALHIVARNSRSWDLEKYLILLLQNGADVNIQDKRGWTALLEASRKSNKESSIKTVKILLEHGAKVNIQNEYGDTALILAVKYSKTESNIETVKLLLEHGANVNIQNSYGWTALLHAVDNLNYSSNIETVKLLIDYGADPTIKNKDGKDVVKETQAYFNEKIIKELEHQISVLNASPMPGKAFIEDFVKLYYNKNVNNVDNVNNIDELVNNFISGYNEILQKNLKNIVEDIIKNIELNK